MSAAEVIAEIQKLPPKEREQVKQFIVEEAVSGTTSVESDRTARADATIDRILAANAEVFRKLAQ